MAASLSHAAIENALTDAGAVLIDSSAASIDGGPGVRLKKE